MAFHPYAGASDREHPCPSKTDTSSGVRVFHVKRTLPHQSLAPPPPRKTKNRRLADVLVKTIRPRRVFPRLNPVGRGTGPTA